MKARFSTTAAAVAIALAGCSYQPNLPDQAAGGRNAIALEADWYGDSAKTIAYLPQGWSADDSLWFYFTTQGSELLLYSFFVNLEQPDGTGLFIDPKYMARFRYLPQNKGPLNPDGLPVGFVRNKNAVGLTCAACHTAQINYRGTGIRVDGAPTASDMVGFLEALETSLQATLKDPAKFDRFATRVLKSQGTAADRAALRKQLEASAAEIATYNSRNASPTPYGFARVDAVGRIYNQVIKFTSGDQNRLIANAPVSYPFIWDAPQHDWVQWIGLTPNAGAGSLGRNAGEVIGVFGKVEPRKQTTKPEKLAGYHSTVEADNLVAMEQSMRKLEAPQWPQQLLPPIDQGRALRGQALYQQNCVSCHKPIVRTDPTRKVAAQMYDVKLVGTDPQEVSNAGAMAPTGILKGALKPGGGATYGDQAPAALLLADLVEGVLTRNAGAAVAATADAIAHGNGAQPSPKQGEYPPNTPDNQYASLAAYKARPLDGIWATAPYLHNGSVPTLYDLLLPEEQRPKQFAVGQLEFDPVKVGFKSDPNDPNAPYRFDTALPGNSNHGHTYGTALGDDDRWALVEYLKTL